MNRQAHAQLPQNGPNVGAVFEPGTKWQDNARDLGNTARGRGKAGSWVPTVINPAAAPSMAEFVLFWAHLLVWVTALILVCITNFGAMGFMTNTSNASRDSDGVLTGGFTVEAYAGTTTTTDFVGITGGIASILGVALLLISAAACDAKEFAGPGEGQFANVFIQLFTLYGTTSTFYIFAQAAEKPTEGYFSLALFTIIFMSYAQVLLYCTSAAIGVAALPRAFIPSLAVSVQFISAMAINSGDFAPTATTEQMTIAWFVPISTLTGVFLMFGLRYLTQPGKLCSKIGVKDVDGVGESSNIGKRPFLRSLVLTPYMVSAVLSVYKLSFVKLDPDPTSYVFAIFGMLLNFSILGVVFNPVAGLNGANPAAKPMTAEVYEQKLPETEGDVV